MAYVRKTNTKNTTTKKKVEEKPVVADPIEEEVIPEEEIIVEAPVEEKKAPKKKQFHADDMILCRSVTVGKLCFVGATNNTVYRWMNYGDEAEVEYRDLASAVRSHSSFIYTPYFIIEDDDFIKEFKELEKFYKEKFTISELTDILRMNENDMEEAIKVLPKGAKEQLINLASTGVADGTLDSVKKIKTLERILDVDFSLVAEIQ